MKFVLMILFSTLLLILGVVGGGALFLRVVER